MRTAAVKGFLARGRRLAASVPPSMLGSAIASGLRVVLAAAAVLAAALAVAGCGGGAVDGAGGAAADDGPARTGSAAAARPAAAERAGAQPVLTPQASGTAALLQAVSAVDERVVWVGGHEGVYLRTVDGGRTWHAADGPGPDSPRRPDRSASRADSAALQFRDVHAVDARTAYLLSAGPGERSRIYKTTDAGESWTLQFLNREPDAFFDCMDFWDARRGVAFSDAVEGEFVIIVTDDGGESWTRVPPDRVPDARPGEASFAASGTCVAAGRDGRAWIGTGAAESARVLRTMDYGRTWSVSTTPVVAGEAAGIASVAFRDALHGVALGGDLARPEAHLDNVARTDDGGATWTLAGRPRLPGAVYGAAYVPGAGTPTLVAAGPGGLDYSRDGGRTWASADTLAYWAVGFAPSGAGWAVGPEGRVVRIDWR